MKILLASILALTPVSAMADEYQEGYSTSRTCFREEYNPEERKTKKSFNDFKF